MSEWEVIWGARDAFIAGFWKTLEMFVLSALIGFAFGVLLLFLLEGRPHPGRRLTKLLIDAMRTVPFLILVYLLYYGLPHFRVRLPADTAGLLALALYHGAYFAEILRSQRLVMPSGYIEAAQAHGFRDGVIYRRIILPNAVMTSLPLLGNQLILCLKDTAFLCIITVREVTAAANSVQSTYFIPLKAFAVAILLYWLVTLAIEYGIRKAGAVSKKRGFQHA
ncbi:MAG: amino acid ABC transporter permease [Aeromonas sp.]